MRVPCGREGEWGAARQGYGRKRVGRRGGGSGHGRAPSARTADQSRGLISVDLNLVDQAVRVTAVTKAFHDVEAKVIEGPVPRQGGRKKASTSVYVRDPDGNLLEFTIYP